MPVRSSFKSSLSFKLFSILAIGLLLLIPAFMVQDIVQERQRLNESARREVSDTWSREQVLKGPYLLIPVPQLRTIVDDGVGNGVPGPKNGTVRTITTIGYLHLLPESLTVRTVIAPEKRQRGIFEVVVYTARLQVKGHFLTSDLEEAIRKHPEAQLENATLNIGLSDLRGIESQPSLRWMASELAFNPGLADSRVSEAGISVPVPLNKYADQLEFSTEIELRGSERLDVLPFGRTTDVFVQSTWKSPHFSGAFLPDSRTVADSGFTAHWNVLHLNRNYPQFWLDSEYSVENSGFGVGLMVPVDGYQKSYRATRYAILFIALTFLVFFFIEVLSRTNVHPVQYILVGTSLVVFFALLLAFSEHIGFNRAYAGSGVATLLLVTGYVRSVLKSWKLAGTVTGMLAMLYLFLFTTIQLEDYALLMGSVGIFTILTVIMIVTRRIDWFALQEEMAASKSAEKAG